MLSSASALRPVTAAVVSATVVTMLAALLAATSAQPAARDAASPAPEATVKTGSFETLWRARTPRRIEAKNTVRSRQVGTRFTARNNGVVHGVAFWKVRQSKGRHVATLWNAKGERLAAATFRGESRRGWQRVTFDAPVSIAAGDRYVVAYDTRTSYGVTSSFRRKPSSSVLALDGARSAVTSIGGSRTFPKNGRRGKNYWVDVLFTPASKSPTPTSSPTPVPGRCAPVPSACGYPDASNTGPTTTTGLVQVPGQRTSGPGWSWNSTYSSVFVTGAGAVLEGLDIAGAVVIDAPDVTLRDSRIASCGGGDDSDVVAIRYRPSAGYNGANASIMRNDIVGTPPGCDRRARSGVRDVFGAAPSVLVDGNDISGTGNGITIEYEGLVVNNWVHDLGHVAGDHHSGISNHGGAAQVSIRHNTVLLHGMESPGGGGVSGALTIYSDFGHAQNVTLEDNLISGGSYVVYGGESGDSYTTPATNIKILNNRFVCGDWLYGPLAAFSSSSSGNELSGNVCDGTLRPIRP